MIYVSISYPNIEIKCRFKPDFDLLEWLEKINDFLPKPIENFKLKITHKNEK